MDQASNKTACKAQDNFTDLAREARYFAAQADGEVRNGSAAHGMAVEVFGENAGHDLGRIALGHYENAAQKYRKAIEWFESAASMGSESLNSEVKELTNRAAKLDAAVLFLNDFLGQN